MKPQRHYRLKNGKYVYRFDGTTYDPELDGEALSSLQDKVFHLMLKGDWVTTAWLVKRVGSDAASVSARIRDLRKPQFGAYKIESRRHPNKEKRVWQYRLRLSSSGKPKFSRTNRQRFHSVAYQRLNKKSKEELILKLLELKKVKKKDKT